MVCLAFQLSNGKLIAWNPRITGTYSKEFFLGQINQIDVPDNFANLVPQKTFLQMLNLIILCKFLQWTIFSSIHCTMSFFANSGNIRPILQIWNQCGRTHREPLLTFRMFRLQNIKQNATRTFHPQNIERIEWWAGRLEREWRFVEQEHKGGG